jgi:hypothetical protein
MTVLLLHVLATAQRVGFFPKKMRGSAHVETSR